jgi:hypothetical protein
MARTEIPKFTAPNVGNIETDIIDNCNANFVELYNGQNYINPLNEGLIGDGVTDDDPAFITMLAKAKSENLPIFIPPNKTFLLSGSHDITDVKIFGLGQTSIIKTESDNVLFTSADGLCSLDNLKILGDATKTNQGGVQIEPSISYAFQSVDINRVTFENIGKIALDIDKTKGGFNGGKVSYCNFINCNFGAVVDADGEYIEFFECDAIGCVYGILINAGNTSIIGGKVTGCTNTGVRFFGGGSNNGHSHIIGTKINHNAINLLVLNLTLGLVVSSCEMYAGTTTIQNSKGVILRDCQFGSATINATDWNGGILGGLYNSSNVTINESGTNVYTNELIDIL